jgi:hypothetical protein
VTAVLAGTFDAIYRALQGTIEMEIDMGEGTTIRGMVLAALKENGYWDEVNSALGPDEEPTCRRQLIVAISAHGTTLSTVCVPTYWRITISTWKRNTLICHRTRGQR